MLNKFWDYLFGQKYVVDGISFRVKRTDNEIRLSTPNGIVSIGENSVWSINYNGLLIEFNSFGICINGEKIG